MIDLIKKREKQAAYFESNSITKEEYIEIIDRAIAAEAKLSEMERQEPVGYFYLDSFTDNKIYQKDEIAGNESSYSPLYARPVQQSPAVAVSENVNDLAEDFIDGMITTSLHDWEYIDVKNAFIGGYERATLYTHTPNTKPKQRITEQDAREIAEAYNDYPHNFTSWLKAEGRTLLAKLNEAKNV